MKKRFLSLILCVVMLAGMLPAGMFTFTVSAEDGDTIIPEIRITLDDQTLESGFNINNTVSEADTILLNGIILNEGVELDIPYSGLENDDGNGLFKKDLYYDSSNWVIRENVSYVLLLSFIPKDGYEFPGDKINIYLNDEIYKADYASRDWMVYVYIPLEYTPSDKKCPKISSTYIGDSSNKKLSYVIAQPGTTYQFKATAAGTNLTSQEFIWSISGNTSSKTTINQNGLLTVASDESLSTERTGHITVTATYTYSPGWVCTCKVNVTDEAPTLKLTLLDKEYKTIEETPSMYAGNSLILGLAFDGNEVNRNVSWKALGATSKDTRVTYTTVSYTTAEGLTLRLKATFQVAEDETAETITLRVNSLATGQSDAYDEIKINIKKKSPVNMVNLNISQGTIYKYIYGDYTAQAANNAFANSKVTVTGNQVTAGTMFLYHRYPGGIYPSNSAEVNVNPSEKEYYATIILTTTQDSYFVDGEACYSYSYNSKNMHYDSGDYVVPKITLKMNGRTLEYGTDYKCSDITTYTDNSGAVYQKWTVFIICKKYLPLQGNVFLPCTPTYGQPISVARSTELSSIHRSELNYEWQYYNGTLWQNVNTLSNWGSIDDYKRLVPGSGLIGQTVRLHITADGYTGYVNSPGKVVVKPNNYNTPSSYINATYSSSTGKIVISSLSTEQEYVVLPEGAALTDTVWENAKSVSLASSSLGFRYDSASNKVEANKTYIVYTRFKEDAGTECAYSNPGSIIKSSSVYTASQKWLTKNGITLGLNGKTYASGDTVYVDISTLSQSTLSFDVQTSPASANSWSSHLWYSTSSAASFVSLGSYTISNNQISVPSASASGSYPTKLKISINGTSNFTISAKYWQNTSEYTYGSWNIVFYNSAAPSGFDVFLSDQSWKHKNYTVAAGEDITPDFLSTLKLMPENSRYQLRWYTGTYTPPANTYSSGYFTKAASQYISVAKYSGGVAGMYPTGEQNAYVFAAVYDSVTGEETIYNDWYYTVSVTGQVKTDTPCAIFTADDFNSGTLWNIESGMKYKIDDGEWIDITSDENIALTDISACNIYVMRTGNGTTTLDSDIQIVTVVNQAAPEGVSKTDCTTLAQNDGTITGVNANMQYKKSDASSWTACTDKAVASLIPGEYYVRCNAQNNELASEYITVVIEKYVAVKESTPCAVFTATENNAGVLSGVESGMKYKIGNGEWKDITSDENITLTNISACNIYVMHTGNGTTTTDSDTQTVTVKKHSAPEGIGKTNCTTEAQNNGTITGVNANMQYKKSDASSWTDCTGETVTVLTCGNYYVRVRPSGEFLASEYVTVTIGSFIAATGIKLNCSSVTLKTGETKTLTATVSPTNADDKTVTWQSSNSNIATVDSTGKVTAVASGTATITAKTSNGKTAVCTVNVEVNKAATPSAYLLPGGSDCGLLGGVSAGMKYRINSRESGEYGEWIDITSSDFIELTDIPVGAIEIVRKGSGTMQDSDSQIIAIEKQATPTNITKTDCTTSDNNDGTISSPELQSMSIRKAPDGYWQSAIDNTVSGLTPGIYYVCYSAKVEHSQLSNNILVYMESESVEVVIGGYLTEVTVSGTATSFGSDSDTVTIELYTLGSDTPAYTTTATGTTAVYSLSGVLAGTYTMRVSKAKYCPREYTVVVTGTSDVTQNAKILPYGDVDGNGETDNKDATQIKRYFNSLSNVIDNTANEDDKAYLLKVADVNRDGEVDNKDATQVKRFFNSLSSVFDSLA